eukprot:gene8093-biopygen3103
MNILRKGGALDNRLPLSATHKPPPPSHSPVFDKGRNTQLRGLRHAGEALERRILMRNDAACLRPPRRHMGTLLTADSVLTLCCSYWSVPIWSRYRADLPRSAPDGDGHDLGRSAQICPTPGKNDLGRLWSRICPDRADFRSLGGLPALPQIWEDMGRLWSSSGCLV